VKPEQIVEATLFASQTPLTPAELARADEGLSDVDVEKAIHVLRKRYEETEAAFQIYQLGDGYQILTRPEFAPYLERFDSVPRPPHLSPAALESLAIIAYRQPIGRIEIEDVRGVSASSVLRTLLDWELITVVGRGDGLGRPLLYGTTDRFLEHFGLKGITDLPSAEELPVALGAAKDEPEAEPELDSESEGEPDARAESEPDAAPDPETAPEPDPTSQLESEPAVDFDFADPEDSASSDVREPPVLGVTAPETAS
jgi:segregation and condensation protein B